MSGTLVNIALPISLVVAVVVVLYCTSQHDTGNDASSAAYATSYQERRIK